MNPPDKSKVKFIKIINNFIEDSDIEKIIKYIDSNLYKFSLDERSIGGHRYSYRFGKCYAHKDSRENLNDLINIKDVIDKYSQKACSLTKKEFNETNDVILASLWLAKQQSGATVTYHKDIDDGKNPQFKYSAVIYLNTMENSGKLRFPIINFEYSPIAGDIVIFPSDGVEFYHGVDAINQDRYTMPMWMTLDKNFELRFSI